MIVHFAGSSCNPQDSHPSLAVYVWCCDWRVSRFRPTTFDEQLALNRDEATEIARRLAAEKGWAWLEPVRAKMSKRSGRTTWTVLSNAQAIGRNVIVTIDDASRSVRRAMFLPAHAK